ncbi:hypothetical protein [Streptomyces sp. SID5910]|uniref:hypothetical protein n=1 Tax=Streptomyces sp. SID5910 TaxID=2690312 RepID=UPI0013722868|nr:hypothetical protein [Streptomyces sp. SID5910]MYR46122.1 hypothetical protein [Streptomyces sp. SID5910]
MKTRNTAVAAVAALAVAFTGVAAHGAVATSGSTATAAAHSAAPKVGSAEDGRALFAGVYFSQGSVAEELSKSPDFRQVTKLSRENSTAEKHKATAAVMSAIEEKQPDFFRAFSEKLRSGDPRKVQSGIADGNTALRALAKDSADAPDPGTASGTCVILAIDVLVVVNAGAAVNLSVAVAIQAWKYVTNASVAPKGEDNSLASEQRIAKLTQILAA